jgi:hypothetical protein
MYWHGHLAIDPSHMTTVRRKPTKGFKRFAEILTAGLLSEKEELETFTALAILQEINRVFRTLSITDLVRFTKDDVILYEDRESQDADDMRMMFEQLERAGSTASRTSSSGSSMFNTLSLLVEHHLESMALVIEVRIMRAHAVGFYPIQIVVNGLAAEFSASSREELEQQMELSFAHQASYDALTAELNEQFEQFMNQLELAIRQQMQMDDLHKSVRTKLLRPRSDEAASNLQPAAAGGKTQAGNQDPVFERFGATSDAFMYCWLWSSLLHSNNLHVSNTTVVDETGQGMFMIGAEGIHAGDTTALDPSVPFAEADVSEWDSLQPVGAEIDSTAWSEGDGGGGARAWLGDFGIGDFGGDAGDAGNCGASCGGGCGGD